MLTTKSVAQHFRERIKEAAANQRLQLLPDTMHYLEVMLVRFINVRNLNLWFSHPLGPALLQALECRGRQRDQQLREVGDTSLFVTGYVPDRLNRRIVSSGYYVELGRRAYGELAWRGQSFDELSRQFLAVVSLLNELSVRDRMTDEKNALAAYARWQDTGSATDLQLLRLHGITPVRQASRNVH